MTGALQGLRVIDLSRILGGPFAGQVLGDHGADVIKVEPPAGDDTRSWGPPFLDDTASYFLGLNRNKRAIALDLRQATGREILLRMLEDADILLENFKIGTLEAWGLGYDEVLSKRFPRLIHCRVSGFGADGPMAGLPGYDAILQSLCGIMSVNGTGESGPTRVGVPVVDMVAGLNAVIGILLALHQRGTTGRGQFVEAALFDSAISLLHPHAANHLLSGNVPQRSGNDHPNISPYSAYATGTCPIYLAVGNDRQFHKLCDEIGMPELSTDARFATNADRVRNRDTLREALEKAMAGMDGPALAEALIRKGVPAEPVLTVPEALRLPHTEHRGMAIRIGSYQGIGAPVTLSDTPASYRTPPPAFAEDRDNILEKLGLTAKEREELDRNGASPRKRRQG